MKNIIIEIKTKMPVSSVIFEDIKKILNNFIFSHNVKYEYQPYKVIIRKLIGDDLVNLYQDMLKYEKEYFYKIFNNYGLKIKNITIEVL